MGQQAVEKQLKESVTKEEMNERLEAIGGEMKGAKEEIEYVKEELHGVRDEVQELALSGMPTNSSETKSMVCHLLFNDVDVDVNVNVDVDVCLSS